MDSGNLSQQAGQAKDQAQEKGSSMMDHAGNAAHSAKDSTQSVGQQMQEKAHNAADSVKDAMGINK